MAATSIPVASACISFLFLLGTLPAQTTDQPGPPPQVSKVRVVRLSEVRGAVQLDRNTGNGYEPVMVNLPIVEHSRLQTGMGIAEVEFEDNSTLRVAPNSVVEFPQLDRLPAGTTASSVRLVKGTAYVSLLKTRGNEFTLLFGEQKLQLPPSSHIRLQIDSELATLAVLDGTVRIDGSGGPTDVSRKNTVTFHLQHQTEPTVAKNVLPETLDSWDKNAAQSHAHSGGSSAFSSPYAYGLSDMMYYGTFISVGGCGSMWRPYFASAAWDPYSNGVWAWYQGAGYSWVSPYPWGWTPFHYGSWSYCSGAGWGWQPGGSWNALNNSVAVVPNGAAPTRYPARPIGPPRPGAPTLSVVNQRPLVRSEVTSGSFVFRRDSAGLGIPREGLGRLNRFSHDAEGRGTATTPVYISAPPSAPGGNGRPGHQGLPASANSVGVTSLHRGSAPGPDQQMHSQPGGWGGGAGAPGEPRSGRQPGMQSQRSGPEPSSQPAPSVAAPISQPAPAAAPSSPPAASPAGGRPR
jgi:hypothetical protein